MLQIDLYGIEVTVIISLSYIFTIHSLTECRISESTTSAMNRISINLLQTQCNEEQYMKTLTIVNEYQIVNYEIYQNIFEDFYVSVRNFQSMNGVNSIDTGTCILLNFTLKELYSFLNDSHTFPWSPINLYILHCIEYIPVEDDALYEYLRPILHRLWKQRYVYKLVVSINGKNIYYDPFETESTRISKTMTNSGYWDPTVEPDISNNAFGNKFIRLPNSSGNDLGSLEIANRNISMSKHRDDFNGYELRVSLFPYLTMGKVDGEYFGVDAEMMRSVCKTMNVSPTFYEPVEMFGWEENGNFTGTLGRLVNFESDVAFNGFFVKDYDTRDIEFTAYLASDEICVIIPKRTKFLEYMFIVVIFSMESWILIFLANFAITFIYVAIKRKIFSNVVTKRARDSRPNACEGYLLDNCDHRGVESRNRILNYLRTCHVSMRADDFSAQVVFYCVYPLERANTRLCERLVIACSLLLGIVLNGSFTSQLASSLSKPTQLKHIDTMRELDDSGLRILTSFPDFLEDVFADGAGSTLLNLRTKLNLANESEIARRVLAVQDAGYLSRKQNILLNDFKADRLHSVKQCPRSYFLSYVVPRGSPFLPRINAIIERLQNSGLYKKWFNDMTKKPKYHEEPKLVVIRLPHLYIPFVILFVGLGISLLLFVCEYIGYM